MKNNRLLVYAVSLSLSLLLHLAITGIEMRLDEPVKPEIKQERLKISLKKFYTETPPQVPAPIVEKTVKEPEKKQVKKIVHKPKKKVEKKVKQPEQKPVKAEQICEEPPEEEVVKEAETLIEPAEEIIQVHEQAEPEPIIPPFNYEEYMDSVLRLIEVNKSYPYLARKKGQQGVVKINVLIGVNGEILDFQLEKSSGYRLLDKDARELVASVFPVENKSGENIRFVIPVRYRLD